jgi:uncharacterized protein (TIGR02145 family)
VGILSLGIYSCKKEHVAIAVITNASEAPLPCPDSIRDIDENRYRVIDAFGQCWLKENLHVAHYQNGDSIQEVLDNAQWAAQNQGAFSKYENNNVNDSIYGKLYNGFAIADPRNVCPTGWHVSSENDWNKLLDSLGGANIAAASLKALELWSLPNTGATNEIGFSALPGGTRDADHGGFFSSLTNTGYWWEATPQNVPGGAVRYMNYPNVNVNRFSFLKKNGFSLRCVRD